MQQNNLKEKTNLWYVPQKNHSRY